MSRPLGATNCSCQQIKVHRFSSIIEGSTAELVKHKALNLVDVGSSPMMGVTSHDVIFIEYIKVPAQYYLIEPALGGYTLLLKFTWSYLQSPCSLLHNNPALGGYTGWSFYEYKTITSPRLRQARQPGTWGLHNMEYSVFTKWLGWTTWISS